MFYFEKIRNNLFYVTNSYYNAEKNYKEDLNTIKKINNNKNINEYKEDKVDNDGEGDVFDEDGNFCKNKKFDKKLFESKIIERMKEEIFFKKNKDLEKKQRINSALEIDVKENKKFNYLGKERKIKKNEHKSIFESKLVDKLLDYCDEKTRLQIISNKIVNEESKGKFKKFRVYKINF